MQFKLILSIVFMTLCLQAASMESIKPLFIKSKYQTSLKKSVKQAIHIKRSRLIDINISLLPQRMPKFTSFGKTEQQALYIHLNLFDDIKYTAQLTKINKSSATATTVWSGTIIGMKHSHISLASTSGVIAGSIRVDSGELYKIKYVDKNTYLVEEVDETKLPKEHKPLTPKHIPKTVSKEALDVSSARLDTGETLDIMVVYTASARAYAGGQAAIESIINASVATMNMTFSNSNIATQVRLVHAEELVYSRGETGLTSGFDTALDDLTYTADGYMDSVHALRDTYRADMVQLLFNNNSSGGLAWVMSNPSANFDAYAFSVVHYDYADGIAFDHEFGHNMGMTHDRTNSTTAGSFSYSYGYQSPTNAWHTIMAYNCVTGCPRIDYWANPTIIYSGELIGSSIGSSEEADAYTTITNNLSTIANWRASPIARPDLVVDSFMINPTNILSIGSVSLNATVLNQGSASSDATSIKYYLSVDNIITTSDRLLSSTPIIGLNTAEEVSNVVNVTIPVLSGVFYLGVCVDSVSSELATQNNCSTSFVIRVNLDSDGDGIADTIDSDDDNDGISDSDELANGLDPLNASDAQADFDNDGFSNSIEVSLGTNIWSSASKPVWTPVMMDDIIIFVPSFS